MTQITKVNIKTHFLNCSILKISYFRGMDTNIFLCEFKCAASSKPHYLIKPILLQCGHHVCDTCAPKEFSKIRCIICDKLTELNSKNDEKSLILNAAIKENIDKLFESIKNLYEKAIDNFNGKNSEIIF